jgi:hypothetical protein
MTTRILIPPATHHIEIDENAYGCFFWSLIETVSGAEIVRSDLAHATAAKADQTARRIAGRRGFTVS